MPAYQGKATAATAARKTSQARQEITVALLVKRRWAQRGGTSKRTATGPLVKTPRPHPPADNNHQPQRRCGPRWASKAVKTPNVTHRARTPSSTSRRPMLTKPGARLKRKAAQKAD